mmetsp:Transcript_118660/g.236368  ORF Transcript_118660/g.236368 Transcript_118660/m.236368 type:complete len:138 (+) Transcript_118660:133-546(+)
MMRHEKNYRRPHTETSMLYLLSFARVGSNLLIVPLCLRLLQPPDCIQDAKEHGNHSCNYEAVKDRILIEVFAVGALPFHLQVVQIGGSISRATLRLEGDDQVADPSEKQSDHQHCPAHEPLHRRALESHTPERFHLH